MANEGIPGSCLYSEPICASRTSGPIPQVILSESQSSLEPWTVIQGEISFRNQTTTFSCIPGNGLPMEDNYGWLETGKFKRWMNWWYLKTCTSFHFPGPKVINLRRHSDERDTSVFTHQWQTSSNSEWYPNTVKESDSGPHMRSVKKNSYNTLLV